MSCISTSHEVWQLQALIMTAFGNGELRQEASRIATLSFTLGCAIHLGQNLSALYKYRTRQPANRPRVVLASRLLEELLNTSEYARANDVGFGIPKVAM
jgi:hypothetical protein